MNGGHDYHQSLARYDPEAILQDGCVECERRGANPAEALAHLDDERFVRAWDRMLARELETEQLHYQICELPLLSLLALMARLLERHMMVRFGTRIPDWPLVP